MQITAFNAQIMYKNTQNDAIFNRKQKKKSSLKRKKKLSV